MELFIPVVISVSSREGSLMFAILLGIPKRETSLYHRAMSETLSLFLGAGVSDN